MDLTSFFNKLEACIIEVANNNLRNSYKEEGSFIDWDVDMCKHWFKLINPPMIYTTSNNIASKECKWELHPAGWSKVDFDGASRGNLGPASLGCIICSNNGSCLIRHDKPLGVMSNNLAKLEALI